MRKLERIFNGEDPNPMWALVNISLKLVIGFFLLILISLKFVFSSLRISLYSSQKRNFVVLVYKH